MPRALARFSYLPRLRLGFLFAQPGTIHVPRAYSPRPRAGENWRRPTKEAEQVKNLERPSLPQFSLRSVLLAIGVIGCELGLIRWFGDDYVAVVIAVTVLPFCLAMELAFQAKIPEQPRMSLGWYLRAHALLVVGGCALSALALYQVYRAGVPRAATPLPFCAVLAPMFELGIWVDYGIPVLAFVAATLYLGRTPNAAPLRLRFALLLGIASVLTADWFWSGWSFGRQYHGSAYVWATLATNVASLLILWAYWFWKRRRVTLLQACAFAWALFAWLFLFAFPWLGELP